MKEMECNFIQNLFMQATFFIYLVIHYFEQSSDIAAVCHVVCFAVCVGM